MRRVIKARWVRRKPATSCYVQTLEAEREYWKQDRIEHLSSLVGSTDRLPGVVSRIKKYGAFVRFNWGEGLVHISQISKNHISHPNEVLFPGQKVLVYVVAIVNSRISLSLIGPGKRKKAETSQPLDAPPKLNVSGKQGTGSPDSKSEVLPPEVIIGKQRMRSFAELAAYVKLKGCN